MIFLVGENSKCILLNWQSKRIRRVVRSSLAAETLAMSDAVDNGVYLTKMLSELLFNDENCIPIEVVTDSKLLYDALHSGPNLEIQGSVRYKEKRALFQQKRTTKI